MATTYEKVENELKVVKQVETVSEENTYKLDFLLSQKEAILKQRNDFVEARNKELTEVDALIAKCEELGVKSDIAIEEAKALELESDKIIN